MKSSDRSLIRMFFLGSSSSQKEIGNFLSFGTVVSRGSEHYAENRSSREERSNFRNELEVELVKERKVCTRKLPFAVKEVVFIVPSKISVLFVRIRSIRCLKEGKKLFPWEAKGRVIVVGKVRKPCPTMAHEIRVQQFFLADLQLALRWFSVSIINSGR